LNRDMTTMTVKISNQKTYQCGFTLLEVLIALLVLSIGLLGLAALQTTGLRSNQMASMRTTATQLAYDIADRMRANEEGMGVTRDALTHELIYTDANDDYLIDYDATDPTATVNCAAAACTPEALAVYDLDQWRTEVRKLPGGTSSIAGPPGAEFNHVITVYWDENRTGATVADDTACPPVDNTEPRCFRLIASE
jgi:type IV pilus assembly protein PilV